MTCHLRGGEKTDRSHGANVARVALEVGRCQRLTPWPADLHGCTTRSGQWVELGSRSPGGYGFGVERCVAHIHAGGA